MNAEIRRADAAAEYLTDERCFILEIANDASDPNLSIARARVPRGITTEWHRVSGIDERYAIVSGVGRVEIGDLPPAVVTAGDVVRIPAGTPQRITNIGDDDLVFLCLCTPRFVQGAYQAGR
ncbi:MAG TPA: cupin domain-containing protein [Vicinamibacterales bacterium]|jgi:mannose-6-phosphate isomerase-like protein (cupin superfamily)